MAGRHWTYEEVACFFKDHGYRLITDIYTGCNQTLVFECLCGRGLAETSFGTFKRKGGKGQCKLCAKESSARWAKINMNDPAVLERRRETFRHNYGTDSPLQNPDVRRRREETCLRQYGVRSVSQVPAIQKRQQEGFKSKYGVDHYMQNPESKARFQETLLKNYGVPSLAFVSGRSSLEGQVFFKAVLNQIPPDLHDKCYFSPKTHEFNMWFNHEYFKYDFVHSGLKKAIEYNGSRFHPHPDQNESETGWCLYHPTRTVREAREYETRKMGGLRSRGFDILVVWDYEAKQDFNLTVSRCIQFLGIKPGNPQ